MKLYYIVLIISQHLNVLVNSMLAHIKLNIYSHT